MNPDYGIILNFKVNANANAQKIVRLARNIGARAISVEGTNDLAPYKEACKDYTIELVNAHGIDLTSANAIDELINFKRNEQHAVFNVELDEIGDLLDEQKAALTLLNDWMHWFGHAYNESGKSTLKTADSNSFICENRHAKYQVYVFIKSPLPKTIKVEGFDHKPMRAEWIDERVELPFSFQNKEVTVELSPYPDGIDYKWRVLRIMKHRPEDDIKETQF